MKHFTSLSDVTDLSALLDKALEIKKSPGKFKAKTQGKTLGLIFLNPSLRTRVSSEKAGNNLQMNVQVLNQAEAWNWELQEDIIMDGSSTEHIIEAARVLGAYCDIVGIRSFPGLKDPELDKKERVISYFKKYAGVPIISLESSLLHPLQSFADLITINETWNKPRKPRVLLCWAPHVKPLPHCVANSFSEWMLGADVEFSVANPIGYDLDQKFVENAKQYHDLESAVMNQDYIYIKNWSSFESYGEMPPVKGNWFIDEKIFSGLSETKFMHCLPVRRNLEMSSIILESKNSLVTEQAKNRVVAMETVLSSLAENL